MIQDDERPFLLAIRAKVGDDTPRLIYADFLEETGQADLVARAEFIRLQCQRSRLPPDDPQTLELLRREQIAFQRWSDHWPQQGRQLFRHSDFTRGFLDRTRIAAEALLEIGPKLTCWIGSSVLRLKDAAGRLEALMHQPWLRDWQRLDLAENGLRSDDVEHLVRSPYLHQLKELSLARNPLLYPSISDLAEASNLANLTLLDVSFTSAESAGARALAVSPTLSKLETLRLASASVGPDGIEAFAYRCELEQLMFLDLRNNRFFFRGVRALATATRLRRIQQLDLRQNCLLEEERQSILRRYGSRVLL